MHLGQDVVVDLLLVVVDLWSLGFGWGPYLKVKFYLMYFKSETFFDLDATCYASQAHQPRMSSGDYSPNMHIPTRKRGRGANVSLSNLSCIILSHTFTLLNLAGMTPCNSLEA